jgi:NCS1 family nucleobase:cation symporter-1
MGENHHIGFTVSSRFSWGMRGSYFPVILRVFVACIWFGLQAYWGGQATRVLWGAIIPGKFLTSRITKKQGLGLTNREGFAHMKNSFSESSHLLTNDFIGLIIWMAAFIPLVLVPPERLQFPFAISFILFGSSCIGILIWYARRYRTSTLPLADPSQGRS